MTSFVSLTHLQKKQKDKKKEKQRSRSRLLGSGRVAYIDVRDPGSFYLVVLPSSAHGFHL